MVNIFKSSLIFFGGVLIGFGTGIIVGNFFLSQGTTYWLTVIVSLISGGFLLALGLVIKRRQKEEEINAQKSKTEESKFVK